MLHLTFLQYWNIEFHPPRLSIHITCDRNSIKPIGYFNGMVRTQLRKYGGMFQLLWRQDSSLWIFIMVGNTETRPTRSLYYVAAVLMVETRWWSLLEAVSVLLSDSENLYWCWHTEGCGSDGAADCGALHYLHIVSWLGGDTVITSFL